jgi:hypothetical protein
MAGSIGSSAIRRIGSGRSSLPIYPSWTLSILVSLLYVLVGLVNFAPVVGVFSASRLENLYGLVLSDPNLIVLMRHRAMLFGIVGVLLFFAAVSPPARPVALFAGFVSMLSFIVLVWTMDESNPALTRVMWIDVGASLLLALAWGLDRLAPTHF